MAMCGDFRLPVEAGHTPVMAASTANGAGLADPMDRVAALLAVVVASAPATTAPSAA
jgi:hypothetical protein